MRDRHAKSQQQRELYTREFLPGLEGLDTVYALDSSTVDLCLSVFPWDPFRSAKAAVKLHTLLDLRGNIPRRVKFNDPETGKSLVFLTNNFALPALTIAQLYKYRWQVELFFKWIKQHLRIKAFFGTSENAVKTQIWSAVCVYVLVAIVKKRLAVKASLYEMLQILSLTLFEKTQLLQLFSWTYLSEISIPCAPNQLNLFD